MKASVILRNVACHFLYRFQRDSQILLRNIGVQPIHELFRQMVFSGIQFLKFRGGNQTQLPLTRRVRQNAQVARCLQLAGKGRFTF